MPGAGRLMRDIPAVAADDALPHVINLFRAHSCEGLAVAQAGKMVGWIREARVAELALDSPELIKTLTVADVLEPVPAAVPPTAAVEELTALFYATGSGALPVVSPFGLYLGILTRADALAARAGWFPPPRIGGMATPLGVYLTTGTVSGGAGTLGLLLTGISFAVILWVTQAGLSLLTAWLAGVTRNAFVLTLSSLLMGNEVSGSLTSQMLLLIVSTVLSFGAFLLLLRFSPLLAGYHAAEHQTVNAIEAGEPLTLEAVGRMSRVHPRCGTNLVSVMTIAYLGVMLLALTLSLRVGLHHLDMVVALASVIVIGTVITWRQLGGWLQTHCTTRPATAIELASGIRAGKELLGRHLALSPSLPPRGMQRFWRMGLIQVLIGASLMGTLLQYSSHVFLDFLWHNLVK